MPPKQAVSLVCELRVENSDNPATAEIRVGGLAVLCRAEQPPVAMAGVPVPLLSCEPKSPRVVAENY